MDAESQPADKGEPVNASGSQADRRVKCTPWSPDQTGKPEPDPRKRGRSGRLTTYVGILLFCVSFFLPQVKACHSDIIPADEASSDGTFLFFLGLPFLFGLSLAVLYSFRYVVRLNFARKMADFVTCVCCVLILIWAALLTGRQVITDKFREDLFSLSKDAVRCVGLTGTVWICMAMAAVAVVVPSMGRSRRPICVSCCAVPALYYFLGLVETARYGLWVSVTACTLIAVGSAWEAVRMARARASP